MNAASELLLYPHIEATLWTELRRTATDAAFIPTPLKDLMLKLDPEVFWRIHRNAIVRVSAIRQIKPDEDGRLLVWLQCIAEPLRVSDTFRHRFRAM